MTKHQAINDFLSVSKSQKETFERDGVLKLEGVLSPEQIALLRTAADQQLNNWATSETAYDFQDISNQIFSGAEEVKVAGATRFDMEFYRQAVVADEKARPLQEKKSPNAKGDGKFFYDAAGWRKFDDIRKVAMDSVLPEIAANLLSSEYINFWEDTTFIKTPNTPQRTAFHQDKAYFQIAGNKCCIMWIALDRTDEENGALEYVRGSHKWGEEYAPNVFFAQTPFPHSDAKPLEDIEGNREKYDIVRINANPGDIIIHHVLTVHGSGGNMSADRQRRAISLRYCGDDIRYHDRPGAIPQSWLNASPEEGSALYSYDYPRVYPRPYPGAEISKLYKDLV